MKYDLAVFDMDGTILNTLEDLTISLNYSLKKSNFPTRSITEVQQFVGNGIRKLIERAVPKDTSKEEIDIVHSDFTDHYKIHCYDNTKPYAGVTELIMRLKKAGCLTAVVSNKADYAVQELCDKFFNGLFDFSLGEKPGINKKPSPDPVNEVLIQLGVSKNRTVYIGDSDVDLQTAKNSEIDCIAVDWGFKGRDFLKQNGAETIVSSADEIDKIILQKDC